MPVDNCVTLLAEQRSRLWDSGLNIKEEGVNEVSTIQYMVQLSRKYNSIIARMDLVLFLITIILNEW